jgi:uncharacterized protein (DUF58 family)
MSALNKQNYEDVLQGFFPAGAFTDERQLTQLRLLAKRLRLASLPQIHGMLAGSHQSKQKGRGLDLDQLRIYQAGDDIRSIDWRVTARTQKPHTRVYKEERERPIAILCDQRSPMFFGSKRSFKSVVAAQCAALIAWAAVDHGDRIGAYIIGDDSEMDFRPKQRISHVLNILKNINEFNKKLENPRPIKKTFSNGLAHLKQTLTPGTSLYLISDFYDLTEKDKNTLYQLKRHNHIVALQVLDPLEQTAPPPGLYGVSDGANHGYIDTQNKNTQQAYKEAIDVWQQGIKTTFKQLGIVHKYIDAGEIPFSALQLAVQQRGA